MNVREQAGPCSPCGDIGDSRYHKRPGPQLSSTSVKYHQCRDMLRGSSLTLERIGRLTPKLQGHERFSTIEVVHSGGAVAERLAAAPRIDAGCPVRFYELPETRCDPTAEFRAIFEVEEAMMLNRANRQSLVVWVGRPGRPDLDGFAGFLGMLPFRGVTVALVTCDAVRYPDPYRYATPSGVFEYDASDPARMGKCCVHSVFGPLAPRTFTSTLREWRPIDVVPRPSEPMTRLPFKIAGLPLPMITFTGDYAAGVDELAARVACAYEREGGRPFPVVCCGETVDRLGYGLDVLRAIERATGDRGLYFVHRSGETFKRWAEYGVPELLEAVARAKEEGRQVLFLPVGGGCNGNAAGVMAAMTNSDFVEVPTTPLHYNDATTSAKKAFSLVVDGKIRSKNLLGTFYLPRLVWCINETLLTSDSASIHSTVGECTKTMNVLADTASAAGQADYANILGAHEFASDTTRILSHVGGFEELVSFVQHPETRAAKRAVLDLGGRIAELRAAAGKTVSGARAAAALAAAEAEVASLVAERRRRLCAFRARFYSLPPQSREAIDAFLTVSNREIVGAKAMFLAYEDPFEKYRALLFEYAHTLGHAVEAWLAGVHVRARAAGVPAELREPAVRNHGQCVGMAVLWAGAISHALGALDGDGFACHQAMVYLFNSHGGFSFAPVRRLCEALGIGREEFLDEALAAVRLDNKRGYCECGAEVSVDQLVAHRPGRMLKSADPNAEVRYMVSIEEAVQRAALERAFDLEFDNVAHLEGGALVFKPLAAEPRPAGAGGAIAAEVRRRIRAACATDAAADAAERAEAEKVTAEAVAEAVAEAAEAAEAAAMAAMAEAAEAAEAAKAEAEATAMADEGAGASPPPLGSPLTSEAAAASSTLASEASSASSSASVSASDSDVWSDDEVESAISRSGTRERDLHHGVARHPQSKDQIKRALERLPDFSLVSAELREDYRRWRAEKPRGATGEAASEPRAKRATRDHEVGGLGFGTTRDARAYAH